MIAYLARELAGQMVKDIAEHFGMNPMRISQAIIEVEGRLRQEESFGKMLGDLEEGLLKQAKKKFFITIA